MLCVPLSFQRKVSLSGSGHLSTCRDGEVPRGSEVKASHACVSCCKKQVAKLEPLLSKSEMMKSV